MAEFKPETLDHKIIREYTERVIDTILDGPGFAEAHKTPKYKETHYDSLTGLLLNEFNYRTQYVDIEDLGPFIEEYVAEYCREKLKIRYSAEDVAERFPVAPLVSELVEAGLLLKTPLMPGLAEDLTCDIKEMIEQAAQDEDIHIDLSEQQYSEFFHRLMRAFVEIANDQEGYREQSLIHSKLLRVLEDELHSLLQLSRSPRFADNEDITLFINQHFFPSYGNNGFRYGDEEYTDEDEKRGDEISALIETAVEKLLDLERTGEEKPMTKPTHNHSEPTNEERHDGKTAVLRAPLRQIVEIAVRETLVRHLEAMIPECLEGKVRESVIDTVAERSQALAVALADMESYRVGGNGVFSATESAKLSGRVFDIFCEDRHFAELVIHKDFPAFLENEEYSALLQEENLKPNIRQGTVDDMLKSVVEAVKQLYLPKEQWTAKYQSGARQSGRDNNPGYF